MHNHEHQNKRDITQQRVGRTMEIHCQRRDLSFVHLANTGRIDEHRIIGNLRTTKGKNLFKGGRTQRTKPPQKIWIRNQHI